jgi:hypothetical protein
MNKAKAHGGSRLGTAIVETLWRIVHIFSMLVFHNSSTAMQVLAESTGVTHES